LIKANGGNAPVIVVVNKVDLNPSYKFDEQRYKKKFNIVAVLYLSAVDEGQIDQSIGKYITHNIVDLIRGINYPVKSLEITKFPLLPVCLI
jgi:50S ribosomal subunit-associated GTPase HflX